MGLVQVLGMLFTGLLGAWLAAVILIPRVEIYSGFCKFFYFSADHRTLSMAQLAKVAL